MFGKALVSRPYTFFEKNNLQFKNGVKKSENELLYLFKYKYVDICRQIRFYLLQNYSLETVLKTPRLSWSSTYIFKSSPFIITRWNCLYYKVVNNKVGYLLLIVTQWWWSEEERWRLCDRCRCWSGRVWGWAGRGPATGRCSAHCSQGPMRSAETTRTVSPHTSVSVSQ